MSRSRDYRTEPLSTDKMPPGIGYIVGNEAAERFSFYGMKAILTVFMTQYLMNASGESAGLSPEEAKAALGYFGMAVYATPLLGAFLADLFFGKYHTILALSLVYCLGHGVLALIDVPMGEGVEPIWILYAGLGLIALGAGGIKPCVSSHVGDQFGKKNQDLMTRVYGWFYFSINFGSTFSTLLTPWLLINFGAAWAFGVPGVLMAIATLMFWLGRHEYAHIPPRGKQLLKETLGPEGRHALWNLTPLLLLAAPFWSLFDQTASAWVLQAENMDRQLISLGGWQLTPDMSQLQATNPIFVMLLVPLFAYGLYPFLGRFLEVTAFRKIGAGMVLAAASFALVAVVESWIVAGHTPSAWWQVLAYLILTAGEVMLSITLLEFFYTQAPLSMKSIIMATYMLSISLGNYITAIVNELIQADDGTVLLPGASYYWFFTGMMIVTAIVFMAWSRFYKERTYMQDTNRSAAPEVADIAEATV